MKIKEQVIVIRCTKIQAVGRMRYIPKVQNQSLLGSAMCLKACKLVLFMHHSKQVFHIFFSVFFLTDMSWL